MDRRILVPLVALVLAALACAGSAPTAEPPPAEATATWTLIPPFPTGTPTLAATPTPAMLTVRDIEAKRKELTDLQWEGYSQEVVGEPIRFSGKVIEVHDDARVQIRDGKGFLTVVILYEVPLDVAAGLNKDQAVEGEGAVREVNTTLILAVWIDVEAIR